MRPRAQESFRVRGNRNNGAVCGRHAVGAVLLDATFEEHSASPHGAKHLGARKDGHPHELLGVRVVRLLGSGSSSVGDLSSALAPLACLGWWGCQLRS